MSSSGAVTLGEIAGRLLMLEVACSHCERHGRLDVAKLIERHGADTRLPDLRVNLAGDCPRIGAASIDERCGQASRVWRLAGDAATPAVKQHLRDLAANFERIAEGLGEDAYPANTAARLDVGA